MVRVKAICNCASSEVSAKVDFVKLYTMFGHLSEKGFDNAHPLINKIQETLKSMAHNATRINTMCKRLHSSLKEDVVEVLNDVIEDHTGKQRGRYKTNTSKKRTSARARSHASKRVSWRRTVKLVSC